MIDHKYSGVGIKRYFLYRALNQYFNIHSHA